MTNLTVSADLEGVADAPVPLVEVLHVLPVQVGKVRVRVAAAEEVSHAVKGAQAGANAVGAVDLECISGCLFTFCTRLGVIRFRNKFVHF